MNRIFIRHTQGTRANQVDEFQSGGFSEILIGRDESSTVRFDADREDLVSRNHARIYADPAGSESFYITDLRSRNGTFLNRQRISAPSRIHHGDVVQLGSGGPEFRLELDPPPAAAARPTRVVSPGESRDLAGTLARTTRIAGTSDAGQPRPIGRATVERMLDDNFGRVKRESGKTLWAGIAAVILIVVFGGGAYLYMRHAAEESARRLQNQQQLLAQMADVVKREPGDDAAVRAQMDKLTAEMKRIVAQNQASPQSGSAGAAPSGSAADAPASYDAGLGQAEQFYNAGNYKDAYAECVQISEIDPGRWEGYFYAGLSAEGLNRPDDALTAYQYALQDAPDDQKTQITTRINSLQTSAGQAN
ncbi:MAG: FHA domain-containing protein [Terracidiphilus sp.]|jgi:hypothetical protein